jgi:YVTN family beta-propeller protein
MKPTAVLLLLTAVLAAMPAATSPAGEPRTVVRVAEPGQTLADIMTRFDYVKTDVDPGVEPEGDYLDRAVFTPDGGKVVVSNRMTGNITVFDWATMAVETTLAVGSYPAGMAATDHLLVIARPFADSVTIVRLADWAVVARLPSGAQPWVVRTSPDGTRAYVACDISNSCEVYDLAGLAHVATLADFPCYLVTVSWNSENGRFHADFNGFEVTPDGNHLVVPDTGNFIYWVDTGTGAKVDTVAGIGRCWFVRYSGDSTRLVTARYSTPCVALQLDVAGRAVTDSVVIAGYALSTIDAAVSADGSRAFLGTGNNTCTLVDFAAGSFTTFSQTYTAFWLGTSPDHSLAISGQYRFSVIDFATGTMRGQHQGNSQSVGAVAPVGTRAVSFDPHRHEGVYFYDYANPTPVYRGTTSSGGAPEGDAPHRVAVSPDGRRVVATNVLSDNLSIIDPATAAVVAVLPLGDRPQDIAFTSDSRWAVAAGLNGNAVAVVDLADNSATTLAVPGGPATVIITPGDSFACVGNIGANTVSVIRLDGAASHVIATIPCGEIGVVWAAYGVWSGLGVSPEGRHLLVAVSFEDLVRVIDTGTWSVVAELAVGDFPLCFAFDSTGEYATVTNYQSGTYSVLHLDGVGSSVVGTFGSGQYPMRVAYNSALDQIGIGNYGARTLTLANPRTGAHISTISYSSYGALVDVAFDAAGLPIVLTGSTGSAPGHVHRGTDRVELPAVPCAFAWNPWAELCAVASPGPDLVPIIKWESSGAHELHTPSARRARVTLTAPAVARERARLGIVLAGPAHARVRAYDAAGRCVTTILDAPLPAGSHPLDWHAAGLPAGSYVIRLTAGADSATRPLTLLR